MENDVAIKVENLSKVYKLFNKPSDRLKEALHPFGKKYHRDFYALNNVSFEVKRGDIIGIVGKNGSGKSTLLKMITGVATPSAGKLEINGKISALLELGAGFNPEFTGIQNVYMNGTIMGYSKEEMDAKIDDILAFADIGEFVHQPVRMYSSGMFVRLAFAVAANVEPEILIVDEALAVGDIQFQLKCINKMKAFKEQGKTIIFVSHDIGIIRNFCNHAIWLMNGQIQKMGDVHLVTELYEDYMKTDTQVLEQRSNTQSSNAANEILKVNKISFFNSAGEEKEVFKINELDRIVVNYTLNQRFPGLVAGIAIFDRQNVYVCGLNTKLDNYPLSGEPGTYTLALSYKNFMLSTGTYDLHIGFMESSAIVAINFMSYATSFRVETGEYNGEGLLLLDHEWELIEHEI